ncbi:MAG: metal ABC transporter permease [Verrucomicrobia bacterium]|nr:MAG: metal ABC transporter permease [Verrucomicrobiota bacterium]
MHLLFEPLQYGFMRDALLIGSIVAITCSLLSCFLVLRGWALMGDAISHAVLPGIVIAYLIKLPLAVGAFFAGLSCAVVTGFIKQHSRLKEDAIMGVVFTGMFAFGLVLFSKVHSSLHLDHILLGNILGIEPHHRLQTYWIGSLVSLAVFLKRRDLLLICFDASHARVIAMPAARMENFLLVCVALAIVASLQAVGIILVIAMLVIPGSTAQLWTDRFDRMLGIAVSSAVLSTLLGVLTSFHINGSPSACIVLIQALGFIISLIFAPKYGLIRQWRKAHALATREGD